MEKELKELKRNIAWVRNEKPVLRPDGVFGMSVTMNPCAIVENGTVFLFYAADSIDPDKKYNERDLKRQINLATAPADDPENFTYYGVVIDNDPVYGSFDYAWCVLPHVVKIREGLYYMLYSGNRGFGGSLGSFPGLGAAWSTDLYHWQKYENNPVLTVDGEPFTDIIGIAGGGLYKEDTADGYDLHLFYTACPTKGNNVFLDQQKSCNYATSTDGIHWVKRGEVHKRTTSKDYENIASTGGPAIRENGLWQHWYSAIGSKWGVYSVCYAESEDGINWTRGIRYGENLALGPKMRDVGELIFRPQAERWQDTSVSYPSIIKIGNRLRMYYCGNDYGCGGIGTAVSAPMRLSLTGETGGKAKIWLFGKEGFVPVTLCESVKTKEYETLEGGRFEEGITSDVTPFFEQFPTNGKDEPISIRVIAVHKKDCIRIDWMAENRTDREITDVKICIKGFEPPFTLEFSNAEMSVEGNIFKIDFGTLSPFGTGCVRGFLKCD